MSTSYNVQYQKVMDQYKAKLEKYNQSVTSDNYFRIISTMPFEFLNAIQLCEKLSLYARLEKKPRMFFSSKEEAIVFYKTLISFRKRASDLLEDAAFLQQIEDMAMEINDLVAESPYLAKNCYVKLNYDITSLADRCLEEIPQYSQLCTKSFRWNYIESIILSLSVDDLKWMVNANIIKAEDIEHISLTEEMNDYQSKIQEICQSLSIKPPIIQTYNLKLKGVTFSNNDGSSRQELLKQLSEEIKTNPHPRLITRSYIYTPEIGSPESALAIVYNGKDIGYIGKEVIAEIKSQFKNPQYKVELEDVYGGKNNLSYGCKIKLNVIVPEKNYIYSDITCDKNL